MANIIKTDIEGIIRELNISTSDVLYPFYETVVNSIQSIQERGKDFTNGKIVVEIERDKSELELFEKLEHFPINKITITDNGIGFTLSNLQSFEHAHSTKKINIGGKGLGRFAVLSVFDNINISSIIETGSSNKLIKFGLSRKEGLTEPEYYDTKNEISTKIVLEGINAKFKAESAKYSHERIADGILSHCLLYYLSNNVPHIEIVEDGITINLSNQFAPNDFIKHTVRDTIKGSEFTWYFVLNNKIKYHEILLCAHDRKVKGKRADKIYPIFSSPFEYDSQSVYFTIYIVSPYLDSIVNMSRNEFRFPVKKNDSEDVSVTDLELNFQIDDNPIFENDIDEKTIEIIKKLFTDVIEERTKARQNIVESYLSSDEGLEYRHLSLNDDFYSSLPNDIDEKELDDRLHAYQFKKSKEAKKKKDKLFNRDYSNKEDYQNLLREVVDSTTQEGYCHLAQYISHRKTIIKLLEKYLTWSEDNNDYEREEALHNLFYTMGGNQDTMPYDKHNLWLLDDRLTFHRYIYSDKMIKSHIPAEGSTCRKETDIAIYDKTFYYGEKNNYSEINSVVIFEFKRPNRMVTYEEYSKQMREQIRGVQEGRLKDYNKANVLTGSNTPIFYYYVIDANTYSKLKDDCKLEGFSETPYKSLMRMRENVYQEILTYQTILINAKRRNQIFFNKLGI